jgi:tetratricopeptide (TPR) repeat protein
MRKRTRSWLGGLLWLAACGTTPAASTTPAEPAIEDGSNPNRTGDPDPTVSTTRGESGAGECGALLCPAPPDPRLVDARERFMLGVQLFERGDYNRALLEFRATYELAPRGAILFNIAQCQERLGDLQGALGTYQHFLHASDEQLPDDQRRAAFERVQQLERQLGLR